MYSTLFATIVVFAVAALRARADIYVPTIPFTQCQQVTLTWGSTQGPYDVAIVPSANPCGDALVDFGDINITNNSYQWKVNITAGTSVMISVIDANDDEGWSGAISVGSSGDNSCLTSNTPNDTPYSSHSPTSTSRTTSSSPAATLVGAANSGLVPNGASMIHLSGVAVVFTALCTLAALL